MNIDDKFDDRCSRIYKYLCKIDMKVRKTIHIHLEKEDLQSCATLSVLQAYKERSDVSNGFWQYARCNAYSNYIEELNSKTALTGISMGELDKIIAYVSDDEENDSDKKHEANEYEIERHKNLTNNYKALVYALQYDETDIDEIEVKRDMYDFTERERQITREAFYTVFKTLSNREKMVIMLRYGFISGRSYTYSGIGELLGVNCERVRQIHNKALRQLRHPSRTRLLDNCINSYDIAYYRENLLDNNLLQIVKNDSTCDIDNEVSEYFGTVKELDTAARQLNTYKRDYEKARLNRYKKGYERLENHSKEKDEQYMEADKAYHIKRAMFKTQKAKVGILDSKLDKVAETMINIGETMKFV